MLTQMRLQQPAGVCARSRPNAWPRSRRLACVARASGGAPAEPFNEGAAQVKRLVQRDRKEFLGNEIDILDKYEREFGTPADTSSTPSSSPGAAPAPAASTTATAATTTSTSSSSSSSSSSAGAGAAPASASALQSAAASSFTASKAAAPASPFAGGGGAPGGGYRKASIEPRGLTPDMSPDPLERPAATGQGNWLSRITLTQVVLVLSFSTIIGLMIATFSVVVNTGAVRLSGI